jgi:hypothetical protein
MSVEDQAQVQTFAQDVAGSYEETVAETLKVEIADVAVTCLYRKEDQSMLDLLTLGKTCAVEPSLPRGRRLQRHLGSGDAFGVQVELIGDAVGTVADRGESAITDDLANTEVKIESEGKIVVAAVGDVGVEIPTTALAPTSTPFPTSIGETTTTPQAPKAPLRTPPPPPTAPMDSNDSARTISVAFGSLSLLVCMCGAAGKVVGSSARGKTEERPVTLTVAREAERPPWHSLKNVVALTNNFRTTKLDKVLGVQLEFLLGPFPELAKQAVRKELQESPEKINQFGEVNAENPPFSAIACSMFYGPNGWGYKKVCPRDRIMGCAFVDALQFPQKGEANIFCSWVWNYPLETFLDAFITWADTHETPVATTYIWICAFCNNQYRIMGGNNGNGAFNLEEIFETRLKACGRMVAVLDSWEQPPEVRTSYITRIWCIYEQYTALKLGIPVEFILPKEEAKEFVKNLQKNGMNFIKEKLTAIECRNAVASNEKDQVKVKGIIEAEYGYDQVNKKVRARFARWCGDTFHAALTHQDTRLPSKSKTGLKAEEAAAGTAESCAEEEHAQAEEAAEKARTGFPGNSLNLEIIKFQEVTPEYTPDPIVHEPREQEPWRWCQIFEGCDCKAEDRAQTPRPSLAAPAY